MKRFVEGPDGQPIEVDVDTGLSLEEAQARANEYERTKKLATARAAENATVYKPSELKRHKLDEATGEIYEVDEAGERLSEPQLELGPEA